MTASATYTATTQKVSKIRITFVLAFVPLWESVHKELLSVMRLIVMPAATFQCSTVRLKPQLTSSCALCGTASTYAANKLRKPHVKRSQEPQATVTQRQYLHDTARWLLAQRALLLARVERLRHAVHGDRILCAGGKHTARRLHGSIRLASANVRNYGGKMGSDNVTHNKFRVTKSLAAKNKVVRT
jgi:hypothetical protein